VAAPTAQSAAIVCDHLVKIYKHAELEVHALQGLDLVVNRGELLGTVGASGSGKSTLMNILGGLDRPTAGRVWVDGLDLLNLSGAALDRYRRTRVGFVWQQGARNLIPYLNALGNVELPMTLAGRSGSGRRQRAEELLEVVGLTTRRTHRLVELSGGEQQRVAIAVALANSPHILLADEPTGELDSSTALSIYQLFRDLNIHYGITIVIVSHDPTLARHVDRVVAVRDGRVATEILRAARPGAGATAADPLHDDIVQELTVIDSAGRLQIPKDYLRQLNMTTRVALELTDTGILIKPADAGHDVSAEAIGMALADRPRAHRPRGWFARILRIVRSERRQDGPHRD
jgi:ABC-type lipoprotein export system ATPase subunit